MDRGAQQKIFKRLLYHKVYREYGPFVFRIFNDDINNTGSQNADIFYQLVVENTSVDPQMVEGGNALIEGRNISIKQTSEGTGMPGCWQTIFPRTSHKLYNEIGWKAVHDREAIIASFQANRLLVIELDKQDNNNCENLTMQVYIDQQPLKQNGTPLRWAAPGAVMTYGKEVAVKTSGECQRNRIYGTLRYSFPAPAE